MKGKHGVIAERRREQQEAAAALAATERRAQRAEAEAAQLADRLRSLDATLRETVRDLRAQLDSQRPPALVAAEEANVHLTERVRYLEKRVRMETDLTIEFWSVAVAALARAGVTGADADIALGVTPDSRFMKGERGEALYRARAKRHGARTAAQGGDRIRSMAEQVADYEGATS
jgi:hypothetical protein